MRESDIVSTMVIHYSSEGEGAVIAGADRVAAAQDKVAASANALASASESSARRQASAQAGFDSLVRRVDPAARALFEFQKNYELVTRALSRNQSPATIDAANRALDVYRTKLAEAESAQGKFFGALSNKTIDIKFNIGGTSAGSAKASADAFMAQFGGLEGIAKSRAAQIGQQFGASLDTAMVAGISKSARESAAVFTAELDRLESIAHAKASQIGKNFQDDLNRSLNIGTGSKSASQSADVFKETILAQEDAISKLRASMRPLETEQGRLGTQMAMYRTMVKEGTMTAHEYATAQDMAGKRLGDFANNLRSAGSTGRVMSGEMANLGFQLNDIATGLALGQSPFMILAQQGGQVVQIFQQSRASIGDFASAAFAWVRSLITVPVAVAGITAAFVALDYAISKSGEELEKLKKRFEGIAGIKLGGEFSKGLEGVSRSLGTSMGAIQPAYESLVRLSQLKMPRDGIQILGPGLPEYFDKSLFSAEKLGEAVKTVYQQLRLGGATAADSAAATNEFFESVSKSGKMTGKDLETLYKAAPQAAQSITNVLTNGKLSADKFIEVLDKTPISFGRLLDSVRKNGPSGEAALNKLGTATDAAFQKMINEPKNVEDAWTKLEMKIKDVWRAIAGETSNAPSGQGHVPVLAQGVSMLADVVAGRVPAIRSGMAAISDAFDPAKQAVRGWGEVLTDVSMKNGLFVNAASVIIPTMVKIGAAAAEAMAPFAMAFQSAFDSALGSMSAFGASFDRWVAGLVASAMSAAQKVASAIASMMSNSGGGGSGAGSASNNSMGDMGGGYNFDGSSASDGGFSSNLGAAYVDSSGGFNPTANDYGGGSSDYGYFATGGQFTVEGSGGVDSETVTFKATPGEIVTVTAPGSSTNTLGSIMPTNSSSSATTLDSLIPSNDNSPSAQNDVLSSHISQYLQQQTAALKDKLDQATSTISDAVAKAGKTIDDTLKDIVATALATSAPTSVATGATSATSGASTPSTGGSGGGGGGGGGGLNSKNEKTTPTPTETMSPLEDLIRQIESGGVRRGTGNPIRGASFGKDNTQPGNNWSSPGVGRDKDGLVYPPSGAVDEKGMPKRTGLAPLGPRSDPEWGKSAQAVKQQTDALKQSEAQSSKTVEKAVHESANAYDRVGSKTNESLAGVKNAAETTSESMGGIKEASELTKGAVTEGNTQQQEGLTQANQSLGEQTSATTQGFGEANSALQEVNSGVGQASEAIRSGDQAIADATRSIESGIVSAVSEAASTISNAISSAASNIASAVQGAVGSSSSNSSDSSGYGGSSGGNSPETINYGGGSSEDGYFATGGQFTVNGPAGTDTEKVEFWASPGEVVTITPPGGRAPPNPARGVSAKNGSPAFATGGQITLGSMFGTPTIEKGSADLISASISETMANQLAAIGNKIDLVSNRMVDTTNAAMKAIDSSISRLSSKIPDPVPEEPAPVSSSVATVQSSSTSSGWGGRVGFRDTPGMLLFDNSPHTGFNNNPGARQRSIEDTYGSRWWSNRGFATGGQFKVGRGGLPAFETGGQMQINPVDDSGMTMATSVQPSTIASSIENKTQSTTASVGQKIETMDSKLTSAINGGTNRVIAGVNAVGDRFDAWKDSVVTRAKTASAVVAVPSGGGGGGYTGPAPATSSGLTSAAAARTQIAPYGGMAEGGTFIVPGAATAGSDSVNVAIKASPGERIMVLPPDQAKALDEIKNVRRFNPEPLDTFMPALAQDNIPSGGGSNTNYSVVGGAPPQGSSGRTARMGDVKTVNIYVQEGTSADTFIRSRAEIQRAVG